MTDAPKIAVVKAAGVNSLVTLLLERAPAERLAPWQRSLPPETASIVTQRRLASEWLPVEAVAPLYETALKMLFNDDANILYEVGRQQLRNDLSGIYRVFLRVASPHYVADKTAQIYSVYAQHCGTLEVIERAEHSLEIAMMNRPFSSHAFFETLRGSIAGVLELTGVKDVVVATVASPDTDSCVYRATWH